MLLVVDVASRPIPARLRTIFKKILAAHQVHLRMLSDHKSSEGSEAELLYLYCR